MTAPQAVARCPLLHICTPSTHAEREASATLLAIGFILSPSIEHTAPGVCTIDLRGADREKILLRAQTAIAQLGQLDLPATAGIARTPLLALYAARATKDVLIVTEEKNFLHPLLLSVADPSPELAEVLANWGLRTLGDLMALPRDEIVRRFGAEGLALWQRAAGGESRPLNQVVPAREFTAAMDFEHEVETLEPLLFVLRRFLDRLALELITAQLVAVEIELTLRFERGPDYVRRFRLPEPTADIGILFRALHTHLELLTTMASIKAIALRLVPARPLVRQQGIFEADLRDPFGFSETLARLATLVGSDRVGTPQLEDTHRADALKLIPPHAVIPSAAPPVLHAPLGLPLRRFRPPLAARVELTNARPSYVWTEHFSGAVSFCSSALLSNGDWWQNDRAWSRVDWDVSLANGGLYRLLRLCNAFFIEGEYD